MDADVLRGRHALEPAERRIKMAESLEAHGWRHLRHARAGQAEQGRGVGDAVGAQVLEATHAEHIAKEPVEVVGAESRLAGNLLDIERLGVVPVDEVESLLN
jgi:hypothetical protein